MNHDSPLWFINETASHNKKNMDHKAILMQMQDMQPERAAPMGP